MKVTYKGLSDKDKKLREGNLSKMTYPASPEYDITGATGDTLKYRTALREAFEKEIKESLEEELKQADAVIMVRGVACPKGKAVDLKAFRDEDGIPLDKDVFKKFKELVALGIFSDGAEKAGPEKKEAKK